ncbi:hypothetical protein TIFTF001_010307 [Ficus carica]|uniref:superoxide dismutase n=1 Tax=Ficus carica TaxID=3494 RepID=A0AA87ZXZ1_FICCA|nr:hypothetical protein TIFTF001_010307 [Ficus carica]
MAALLAPVATTKPISLPCALVPSTGLHGNLGSPRRLQWTKKMQRLCVRKAGPGKVTAKFELKPPPYPLNALEPHMSKDTFEYHWGKHHRTYVENLNKQIAGTELEGMSLEDIVVMTYNKGDFLPPFNNAAQVWNHDFFWESMKPGGGGKPSGELLQVIKRDFGSFEKFVGDFKTAAATQFGSGWAWLAYKANRLGVGNAVNPNPSEEDKKLVIVKSPNAVNPLVWDYYPLLTIDVWEHAYYLDFQVSSVIIKGIVPAFPYSHLCRVSRLRGRCTRAAFARISLYARNFIVYCECFSAD